MAATSQLYGACACERNQYVVMIPRSSASLAHVFFDNSYANRRSQATPLTAWLSVPLDWYHSTTFAQFPDETHSSIKRTFHTPSPLHAELPPTRRQFCGYCGTHLTKWDDGRQGAADVIDVTLGSLLGESLQVLEALGVIADSAEEGEEEEEEEDHIPPGTQDGLVQGGSVDDEDHVPTNEESMGGVDGPGSAAASSTAARALAAQRMQNRGMPWFEEMVENSRLGRIKRQKGGHTSRDGRTTVQWEVVEVGGGGGGEEASPMEGVADGGAAGGNKKRQKLGV